MNRIALILCLPFSTPDPQAFADAWHQVMIEVEPHWVANVRNAPPPEVTKRDYGTRLNLALRQDGTVESIEIIRSSESETLDAAIVAAIKAAEPFEKRPAALIGTDGLIHLNDLGFIVSRSRDNTFHMYGDPRGIKLPKPSRSKSIESPIPIEKLRIQPKLIEGPKPLYPKEARKARLTGNVVVRITADESGTVVDAVIVESAPVFDDAALEAVRKWRYQPLMMNGKPIRWTNDVTLRFELE
jgi:TonB family protein